MDDATLSYLPKNYYYSQRHEKNQVISVCEDLRSFERLNVMMVNVIFFFLIYCQARYLAKSGWVL